MKRFLRKIVGDILEDLLPSIIIAIVDAVTRNNNGEDVDVEKAAKDALRDALNTK